MTAALRNFLSTIFVSVLLLPVSTESASIENKENLIIAHSYVNLIIILVSIAGVVTLSVVVLLCGDCYNSEVSSTNHPACGGNNRGFGADGYRIAQLQDTNTFTDVTNVTSANQALPYSMIPVHIQTEPQFVGYGATPNRNTSGSGEPQLDRRNVSPSQGRTGGRHVNPMEQDVVPEEPPPSYDESLRTGV